MMSGATAAVGASVVDQAPGRSAVVVSAGTFALVEAYGYPYRLGIDYRFGTRGPWSLEPGVGAAFGPDGMFFLHLDLQRDIQVGERWLMSFGLAGGYFANGDGIGVNDHLEFESSIALSRLLDSGLRVGLAVQHVSNGGLETPNNGTEALVVFVRFPLGRPARNLQVGP